MPVCACFQIFALKRVEGLPGPPACRSVPPPWSLALPALCMAKLGLAFRLAFDRLPGHFCGWCLIFMLSMIDCCLHWFTCVSLLAAPASVRSSSGPPLGGCYFYTAARGSCAPLAQVSQSRVVSSSTYLHGVPWCSPLLPAPALDVCVVFLCCLRCLRWPFWAVQLRPFLPVWCMSMPRSLWLLCAFQRGWHALRRILGILLRSACNMPKRPAAKAKTTAKGAARTSADNDSDDTSSCPSPVAIAAPKSRARPKAASRPKACAKQRRRPKRSTQKPTRPPSPESSSSSGSSDSTPYQCFGQFCKF